MNCFKVNKMHNRVRPTFVMLTGIPGSGKSTYADFIKNQHNVYLSSDAIRKELFGNESCQEEHHKVFGLMQERTLEALKNGYDVIYDATNVTRKDRHRILSCLPAYVYKKCIIVWAPIEYCIERDAARERTVGLDVIKKVLKRFEAPFYDEGFDEIEVAYPRGFSSNIYYDGCIRALEIPHDNPHHTADVAEHCKLCGGNLVNLDVPDVLKFAGYIHDIGKPFTKTFVNTKGEITDVAHYYGHQAVGAWISYGISHEFVGADSILLAWLVSTHMAPMINQKYYNSLDPLYKNWIDILHNIKQIWRHINK